MCDARVVVSDLLFIPENLGDKGRSAGDFRVFPCFAALKTNGRWKDGGKENVSKCSRDHHPKLEQALSLSDLFKQQNKEKKLKKNVTPHWVGGRGQPTYPVTKDYARMTSLLVHNKPSEKTKSAATTDCE